MLQLFLLELTTVKLFNQLSPLKERYTIEKELPECILLCLMPLHRLEDCFFKELQYLLVLVACYAAIALLPYAITFSIAGCHRNTVCVFPNRILLTPSVCYGEL